MTKVISHPVWKRSNPVTKLVVLPHPLPRLEFAPRSNCFALEPSVQASSMFSLSGLTRFTRVVRPQIRSLKGRGYFTNQPHIFLLKRQVSSLYLHPLYISPPRKRQVSSPYLQPLYIYPYTFTPIFGKISLRAK